MGLYFEEKKKRDPGVLFSTLVVFAVLALVVWGISKLVTLIRSQGSTFSVLVLGGVATMIIWTISKRLLQDSKEKIKFQGTTTDSTLDQGGMISNWLEGLDENSLLFQRSKSISLAVGTMVGWTMLKLFGGKFRGATLIALVIALVAAGGISKWLRNLEEEKRRKRRYGFMTNFLTVGAAAGAAVVAVGAVAGVAALAGWGMSKSFGSGSEPEPGESSSDKDKMMKAPGRPYHMPRKDFEENPSAYFRHLHAKNY